MEGDLCLVVVAGSRRRRCRRCRCRRRCVVAWGGTKSWSKPNPSPLEMALWCGTRRIKITVAVTPLSSDRQTDRQTDRLTWWGRAKEDPSSRSRSNGRRTPLDQIIIMVVPYHIIDCEGYDCLLTPWHYLSNIIIDD